MSKAVSFTIRVPVVYGVVLDESATPAAIPGTNLTGLHLQTSSGAADLIINGTPYGSAMPPIGFTYEYYAVQNPDNMGDVDPLTDEIYLHIGIPEDSVSDFMSKFVHEADSKLWGFQVLTRLRSKFTETSSGQTPINSFTDLRIWDLNIFWAAKALGVSLHTEVTEDVAIDYADSIPMTCVVHPGLTDNPMFPGTDPVSWHTEARISQIPVQPITDGTFSFTARQAHLMNMTSDYSTVITGYMSDANPVNGYCTAPYDVQTANSLSVDRMLVSIPINADHYAARQGLLSKVSGYAELPVGEEVPTGGDPIYQTWLDAVASMDTQADAELTRTTHLIGETVSDDKLSQDYPLLFEGPSAGAPDYVEVLTKVLNVKKGSWEFDKMSKLNKAYAPDGKLLATFECIDDEDVISRERRLDLET